MLDFTLLCVVLVISVVLGIYLCCICVVYLYCIPIYCVTS